MPETSLRSTDVPAITQRQDPYIDPKAAIPCEAGSYAKSGAVVYVDIDASGANNGSSWTDAFACIQDGIDAAVANDQVWVAEGTYSESITMKTGVAVYGGFDGTETLLSQRDWENNVTTIDASTADGGGPADHVVVMDTVTNARLDGLTITGGQAEGDWPHGSGAGIYCNQVDATNSIANCTVSGNQADAGSGGGLYCSSSSPALTNCTVSGNTAYEGGGLYCRDSSTALTNCTVSGNTAAYGGGLHCADYSSSALTNCTIGGNAAYYGGGLFSLQSHPTMTNTLFKNNTNFAVHEYNSASGAIANNCLFYGNPDGDWRHEGTTSLTGAAAINGLWQASGCVDGDPMFQMDSAQAIAGTWTAVPVYDSGTNRTTLTDSAAALVPGALVGRLVNCDSTQYMQALVTANTATTVEVVGDVTGYAASGDAYVVVDYHLMSGSGAKDLGTATGAPADDFDGDARPVDSFFDIGVDEFLDTDGDTLSDWFEMGFDGDPTTYNPYHPVSNPAGTDLDHGATDTDGDGVDDAVEITGGYDPLDPLSNPGALTEAWVDFAYSGTETGSQAQPFNTLGEAIDAVEAGGTVKVKGDTTDSDTAETPRITKAMRIEAVGGPVRIGVE